VIEHGVQQRLASHSADDGAEDCGHPQQRGKAPAEANAAEICENDQNNHSHEKANDHLGRSQFLWQIWKLRQDLKL
jgi:hypothetical protein